MYEEHWYLCDISAKAIKVKSSTERWHKEIVVLHLHSVSYTTEIGTFESH